MQSIFSIPNYVVFITLTLFFQTPNCFSPELFILLRAGLCTDKLMIFSVLSSFHLLLLCSDQAIFASKLLRQYLYILNQKSQEVNYHTFK